MKLIAIIRAAYDDAKCYVLHRDKIPEDFEVQSGVRQSCILSPVLFFLIGDVLGAALSGERGGIQWTMTSFVKHLDYADNICLLSHRVKDVSQMALNKTKILSRTGHHSLPI